MFCPCTSTAFVIYYTQTDTNKKGGSIMIIENEKYFLETCENAITKFCYKEDGTNIIDKNGNFATACFTLHTEDIKSLPHDKFSPYAEHVSSYDEIQMADDGKILYTDTSNNIKLTCILAEDGLHLDLSTDNDNISSFGINACLNFISKLGYDFKKQIIPTSPYTSDNGEFMYCIMPRPDGKFITATAKSVCDGWRIGYSHFAYGHFIKNFQFLASFDKVYGGSNRKTVSVNIQFADDINAAYAQIQKAYGMPMCINVLSGGFNSKGVIKTLGEADTLKIKKPNGDMVFTEVTDVISLDEYGLYTVIPIKNNKEGLSTTLWNGESFKQTFEKSCHSITLPYHPDRNLCEGGCFLWEMLINGDKKFESVIREELNIIMGKGEYVPRRTIVPHKTEKYAPYHICESGRVQEQFFGVSILLEAYKLYKDKEILEFAVNTLEELADNYTKSGMLLNGNNEDYSTVCCPMIPIVDMANELGALGDSRAAKFKSLAKDLAKHIFSRGLSFPTEGDRSGCEQNGFSGIEYEDGSISCTALSFLYYCMYLERNDEYLCCAAATLDLHNAWRIYTPDARMYGSSFRWWETIWEGDGQGPAICAGHAWSIWRAEAQFMRGILLRDDHALLDSFNGFITNFSKTQKDGTMYSCYEADYIKGGGEIETQEALLQLNENEIGVDYRIGHSYPCHVDNSLSRYAWVRAHKTWYKTAAILNIDGKIIGVNAAEKDGVWETADHVESIYIGNVDREINLKNKSLKVI